VHKRFGKILFFQNFYSTYFEDTSWIEQKQDRVLLLCGRILAFRWHLRVSGGGSGSGNLNHTAPHGAWRLLVVSREYDWKSPIQAWWDTYWGCLDPRHCPLNKHLHNMSLIDEPICIACGKEDESEFYLLCDCPSLISLRMRTFSKPTLSVEKYKGARLPALRRFPLAIGRFTVNLWFVHSYEHFFFLYSLILSVCIFVSSLIFQFQSFNSYKFC
jgi:hypothetical protein